MPSLAQNTMPKQDLSPLEKLGWQPFFIQQVDINDLEQNIPVRITEVHRKDLQVKGETIDQLIPSIPDVTVGDWLLCDPKTLRINHVLDRKSLIKRQAAGHEHKIQLIAANIDTAFITTSCNQDFNIARLERYVALAFEAEVSPVILLTKTDLCEDSDHYIREASKISEQVVVVALNARSEEPQAKLDDWCKPGQTVAFIGSSGVGKSTLVNALQDDDVIKTQAIREDDGKGRHTTTRRQLYALPTGCMVLDTPGMRELQLAHVENGIANLFNDLQGLAQTCRFRDCSHETEPGCAVQAALKSGTIDAERIARWQKLVREEEHNTANLAQRRAKDKAFGKMVRNVMAHKRKR